MVVYLKPANDGTEIITWLLIELGFHNIIEVCYYLTVNNPSYYLPTKLLEGVLRISYVEDRTRRCYFSHCKLSDGLMLVVR